MSKEVFVFTSSTKKKILILGLVGIVLAAVGIAILAFGSRVAAALDAAGELDATVVNMRFVKPLDTDMIEQMAAKHPVIVTVEENALQGGAGSAVNEALLAQGAHNRILNLAIPDEFIEHGDHQQQLAECGLDAAGMLAAIRAAGLASPDLSAEALQQSS